MNNIRPLIYLALSLLTVCWLQYLMKLGKLLSHLHLICDREVFACNSSVAEDSSGMLHWVRGSGSQHFEDT